MRITSDVITLGTGVTSGGSSWELRYRRLGEEDCLELFVDGHEIESACGWDIPNTTDVGFGGGLKHGEGNFFLYGLTSERVASIEAESDGEQSNVQTRNLPEIAGRPSLRFFVIVREPVDDVAALVAFDADGGQVQRIALPKAPKKQPVNEETE